MCATGLALMMLGGVVLGSSNAASMVFAGRLVSGAGAVLFNLVLTKMATDWFAGREIVLAMSVVLASWPFGIAAGLLVQPELAAAHGWRWVMHATAALCGVALLLVAVGYREPTGAEPPRLAPDALAVPALPPRRQVLPAVVAGAMWGNLNLALVLFFSFAPAALAERGVAAVTAAAWTGTALWVVMLSVPLGGLSVQRYGRPHAAIVAFSLLGALALALLPAGVAPLAVGMAFAIAMGVPAGAIMALPAQVLDPEHRAGGLGIFLSVYYLVLALGPALAGMLREIWHTAAAALWFAAFLMASVAALTGVFRRLATRLRVQAT